MKVHTYEKAFLVVGGVLLVACMGALLFASVGLGIHLPGKEGSVDPATVRQTPPFDSPGVRQVGPNRYEAVILGQIWSFQPAEIRVPAGAEVLFTATSTDVIHGFHIEGSSLNMMLIPGQISRKTQTFSKPGEHLILCHEYCGAGHHTMFGKLVVEPAAPGPVPRARSAEEPSQRVE